MNLDTRSKRASSVGLMLMFVLAPPLPDGSVNDENRAHLAATYAGLYADPPSAGSGGISGMSGLYPAPMWWPMGWS